MKKRFIFDLDGTLMHADFSKEKEYFKSILSEDEEKIFVPRIFPLLLEYEDLFTRYDERLLSKFMTEKSGVLITEGMVKEWIDVNSNLDDTLVDGIVDVLEYLKSKDKSLVVLSNWFSKGQMKRLENSGILKYFDNVFGGEYFLKPCKESYFRAIGNYDVSSCVMIGDTLEKDVIVPRKYGIESVYYNELGSSNEYNEAGIKKMIKIKEMY